MHNFSSHPHPLIPAVDVSLSTDDRELAYKRTQDAVSKLNAIRIKAELPPEMFSAIMELHLTTITEVSVEKRIAEYARRDEQARLDLEARTQRLPLKIVSGAKITRGLKVPVIARPQWAAYLIDCIEIEGIPSHWNVHGIKVGNAFQDMQHQELPYSGDLFRKGGPMGDIKLETLQIAMDFSMIVEYVGPDPDGAVFEATAIGKALRP